MHLVAEGQKRWIEGDVSAVLKNRSQVNRGRKDVPSRGENKSKDAEQ